jgi:hypothetical protein
MVLAQTEVYCFRRAHNPEGMLMAQQAVRDFLLDELSMADQEMDERYDRVLPWTG